MATVNYEASNSTKDQSTARMDMKLEIAIIPVSNVDRAKEFYTKLGWRFDGDFVHDDDWRGIQFTPPGSACSIIFGKNVTAAVPGSAQGLYLIVSDIEAARDELLRRGVQVSEAFHDAGDVHAGRDEPYLFGRVRVSGPDPGHGSYRSFASFMIQTAMAGCCRRSRHGCLVASIPRRRASQRQTIWRARFGERRPLTASTRSAPANATRTGRTGTPHTWWRSNLVKSCRNDRLAPYGRLNTNEFTHSSTKGGS